MTSSGAVVQYLPWSEGTVFGRSRLSGQLMTSFGAVVQYLPWSEGTVFGRSRLSGLLMTSSGAVVQYLPRSEGTVFGRSRLSGQLMTSSGAVVQYLPRSEGTVFGRSRLSDAVKVVGIGLTHVMAISVISISSDSSDDSMGTPAGRVILFGTIPSTIPNTTPVITPPATQTDTPDDDTTNSDTPDTPPSPTHGTPFTEITALPEVHPIILVVGVKILHPPGTGLFLMVDHSSSEVSSDFHSDASSDSSSRYSLSDHSSPDLPSTSVGPSRKRRSVEVDPREISMRDDAIVRVSDETHLEQDIDPEIQAEIDECIAYADALRDRWIDARVIVEAVDQDEIETGVRGLVEEGAIEVTYETLGDLVQRFHDHTQAIPVHHMQAIEGLERDNKRLRGTMSVESQRVDRLQRGMSRMQRELRQMRQLQFYDRVRVGRLEACARKHMGYRP
ncbi:hypothetical protein Tco_0224123 [Tanacetum coccineum]